MGIIEALRRELLEMKSEDLRVREALARDGSLFHGYHPRMEQVHRRNAARLREIIAKHGWPGKRLAGEDGAEAAWLIVQHSIGEPDFMRSSLRLLQQAAASGDADPYQPAYLLDRIRVNEGKLQVYGTQFDWDENGEMSPLAIEDPEHVDERRRQIGLRSLDEITREHREGLAQTGEKPPADLKSRIAQMEAWARSAGWRR